MSNWRDLHNEVLNGFANVQPGMKTEELARVLFDEFQRHGSWCSSIAEQCRRLQLTDKEHNAETETYYEKQSLLSDEERAAEDAANMAPLGNLVWITTLDEFCLWQHKRIDCDDMVIHAFHLGYGEAGRSNDPLMYVVYRHGDEDNYDKVFVVQQEIDLLSPLRRRNWVCKPIAEMYSFHQASEAMYG